MAKSGLVGQVEVRVVSIGALAAHPLWEERAPVRAGHATTTLIRAGKRNILVDPGLPGAVIAARLGERSGLKAEEITDVFLTSFKPETCRGVSAFERAAWWVSAPEREGVGVPLVRRLQEAAEAGDEELKSALEVDVAVLHRCQPAPDRLAPGVDLFPMPGVTPGLTGLLVAKARSTVLVCGDAVATVEHLERGMVLPGCFDVGQAQESFREAVEIADELVLGRDNWVVNPMAGRADRAGGVGGLMIGDDED
ncbi:MAG: MBL fold metallo-hydrolase [Phycisphaeraceae bacterium]|nr:MBL fold metallo-hydrolase [Phycisphaeraceae bacterium]